MRTPRRSLPPKKLDKLKELIREGSGEGAGALVKKLPPGETLDVVSHLLATKASGGDLSDLREAAEDLRPDS